jgi:mono/diheme cytochrome c family protein
MRGTGGRAGVVIAVCALLVAALACAESESPRRAQAGTGGAGHVLYLTHCESCHGVEGKGDGPAAGWLRVPPADLTRLWERYGTPLDRERVAGYIDGRMLLSVHGDREMPIWGEEFFEDAPPGSPNLEAARRRLIDLLIEHLEKLQTNRHT